MKLLRLAQVIEMTGLSRSTIYRYESASAFPKRRRTGPNSVRWLEDDVVKWMESRPSVVDERSMPDKHERTLGLLR